MLETFIVTGSHNMEPNTFININQSLPVIKATIHKHLWQHFVTNFHPMFLAHIISAADAPNVLILDLQSISPN